MDAVSVSSILIKTELQTYSYQGETSHNNRISFYSNKKEFASLQNKVNFLGSLDINSHYKQYLEQLKQLKLKKRLLTKFASMLNNHQMEKIKGEIKRSEELLSLSSNYHLQPRETIRTAEKKKPGPKPKEKVQEDGHRREPKEGALGERPGGFLRREP